jgi:hypothetical protein
MSEIYREFSSKELTKGKCKKCNKISDDILKASSLCAVCSVVESYAKDIVSKLLK